MIIKHFSLFFILFFIGCGSTSSSNEAPKPVPTELLLPLYSYPGDTQSGIGNIWDVAAEAATKIPVCIIFGVIRADNVPVGTPNIDYQIGLNKLRINNAKILAYVETTYGSRDIEQIKLDVEAYAKYFDIDGIFFDEVNGDTEFLNYYNEITLYAKSFTSVSEVMLNSPGVKKEFIQGSVAENFLVFENNFKYWDNFDSSQYKGLDYERLHIIVHNVPDSTTMQTVIEEANQKNISNLYITDEEFAYLPSYWYNEVSFIEEQNSLLQ